MSKAFQPENTQEFKQFIIQIFEDLRNKTEDLALNYSKNKKTIKSLPISLTYTSPQVKQYEQLYNKILGNLAQYHLKNQGSKMNTQVFRNLVDKKDRRGITSYMLNCLRLNQQTAQFLTQQLVLGLQCKQAIRQVGSQIFKMENPFTSQCKLFIEKAKSLIKNIYQYKKINQSIVKLEMTLKKNYINRSNNQEVEKYEESSKAMSDLRSEVESRSKMMANFLEQLEDVDFVKRSIKKSSIFSERLESMINIMRNTDNQIKKLQKVKSSYEELKYIQQSYINDIIKVKTNVRNKPIVQEAGFQKELLGFEQQIKKHLQDKSSLQENNRYLNTQIKCRSNGKLQQEQLIRTLQQRIVSVEQALKAKTLKLLDSQSRVKLLQNQVHSTQTRVNKSLHQTTSSLCQIDHFTIKQTEEDRQKIKRLGQQIQVKERQREGLKTKIKESQRSLLKVSYQNKCLENKQKELNKSINYLQQQKIEVRQQCEYIQPQRQRVEAQNQSLLEQIKQPQDHIRVQPSKTIESQHHSSPSQPQEEKNSRSFFTSTIEQHPNQSNQLKTAVAENQQLKQQLQHLKTLNFRLSNQLQLLRSQKEQLQRVDLQNKQIVEQLKVKLSFLQNQHCQNRDQWIKTQKKLSRLIAQKEKQISALRMSMGLTQTEFQFTKQNLAQELKTVEIQCDILKQQQFKVKEQQVVKWQQEAKKYEKQLFYERETLRKQQKKIRDIQKKVKAIFLGNDKEKV